MTILTEINEAVETLHEHIKEQDATIEQLKKEPQEIRAALELVRDRLIGIVVGIKPESDDSDADVPHESH